MFYAEFLSSSQPQMFNARLFLIFLLFLVLLSEARPAEVEMGTKFRWNCKFSFVDPFSFLSLKLCVWLFFKFIFYLIKHFCSIVLVCFFSVAKIFPFHSFVSCSAQHLYNFSFRGIETPRQCMLGAKMPSILPAMLAKIMVDFILSMTALETGTDSEQKQKQKQSDRKREGEVVV